MGYQSLPYLEIKKVVGSKGHDKRKSPLRHVNVRVAFPAKAVHQVTKALRLLSGNVVVYALGQVGPMLKESSGIPPMQHVMEEVSPLLGRQGKSDPNQGSWDGHGVD
jgi:hypothetical protein